MKLLKLSLKASSSLVIFVDLVSAAAVAVLCVLSWQDQGRSAIFWYKPGRKDSNADINRNINACVTFWILSLILFNVYLRLVLASLLFTCVKRRSSRMAYAWVGIKVLSTVFSVFLLLASLTVSFYTRWAAGADFAFHLLTVYHIKTLYEALKEFQRSSSTIKILNDDKSEVAK